MIRDKLPLIAAATCAVVATGFAGGVIAKRLEDPPTVSIPGAKPGTPGVSWTLAAADIVGNEFAVFANPATFSGYGGGATGFIDAGEVLVTLTGLHNYRTSQFDRSQFVGIDSNTGKVRWKTPVPALDRCAAHPAAGRIVCVTMSTNAKPDLITIDTHSGALHKHPLDWTIVAIEVAGEDILTLEGNPEDADLRLHSGSADDLAANWTVAIKAEASWEDSFGDVVTASNGLALVQIGTDTFGIDVATGKQTWSRHYPDCSMGSRVLHNGVTVRTKLDCLTQAVTETELINPSGHVITTVTAVGTPTPQLSLHADDAPILVGAGAFDPNSGKKLWSNPLLASGAIGVVDDVALTSDISKRTLTGLDVRTGTKLWDAPMKNTPAFAADYRGCAVSLQGPYLDATNVRTGRSCWSINTQSLATPRRWDSAGALQQTDAGFVYADDGRMVSLRTDD